MELGVQEPIIVKQLRAINEFNEDMTQHWDSLAVLKMVGCARPGVRASGTGYREDSSVVGLAVLKIFSFFIFEK